MNARHIAAAALAAVTLGLSALSAHAHPGTGFGPGMKGGMNRGGQSPHGEPAAAGKRALMTNEERAALHDQMRSARTPEERQKLAEATRTEMRKRGEERGAALHGPRGPRFGTAPRTPSTNEHAH
jgi:Spy/CpxP family protein refolding chaperone